MKGTHDVFSAEADDEEYSISLKKLKKIGGTMELGKVDVVFSLQWHQKDNLVDSQEM